MRPATQPLHRLIAGDEYRLPSGAVVCFERILRGGEALCVYRNRKDGSQVLRTDEVSFDIDWLKRHARPVGGDR